MTAGELIKILSTFPNDQLVVVNGYEGGLCDILQVSSDRIELNVNKASYLGPHEQEPTGKTQAIIIARKNLDED